MKNTPCLICKSTKHSFLLKHTEDQFIPKISQYFEVQYVFCEECGFTFQNPQPDNETLMKFYHDGEFKMDTSEKYLSSTKADAIQKIAWLNRHYGKGNGKKVLEIGSSSGFFLNELKKINWNVFGIEPSTEFSDYSRNHFGLNVLTGFFNKETFPEETFDLIIALHVLEHTADPLNFLWTIRNKLKKDGMVFLEVPNIFKMRTDRTIADYFCMIHIMMFTPKTIRNMLNQAKFKILSIQVTRRGISVLATPCNETFAKFSKENKKRILHILQRHTLKHNLYLQYKKLRHVFHFLKNLI